MHLEQWLKRGDQLRATVAPHTSKHRKDECNTNTLTRCRSLELLESDKLANRLNHTTPGDLRRSIDVLDSNHHEVIVHRGADDDADTIRSSSVQRSSNPSGSELNRQRYGTENDHRDKERLSSLSGKERLTPSDRARSSLASKSGSDFSKQAKGLIKSKDALSVAERLEELLSKTNEIIQMERIARRKSREGLAMLDMKNRSQLGNDGGLKVSSTSQHGSGSGASAFEDCLVKKFMRLDYKKPDESDENSLIAHEMKRITSSLLGSIGDSNERIIVGKEDDMPASPEISKEFIGRKEMIMSKSHGLEHERSSGLSDESHFSGYASEFNRKMTPGQSSDDQRDEDYDLNDDDGQYYQSDEVDGDVLTTRFDNSIDMAKNPSLSCGFYQNTCFEDISSSSSNTLKSVKQTKDTENVTNSTSDEVDSRCDLPEMANMKELYELKSRILNGAHWRSQVLRKSAQDANKLATEIISTNGHVNGHDTNKITDSDQLVKINGTSDGPTPKNKISELVARFQGFEPKPIPNNFSDDIDNGEHSESSEDELETDFESQRIEPIQNGMYYDHLRTQIQPMTSMPIYPSSGSQLAVNGSVTTGSKHISQFDYNRAQPQIASQTTQQSSQIYSNSRNIDTRCLIPKDAYFHELPNKNHLKPITDNLPEKTSPHIVGRNRNPLPYTITSDIDILSGRSHPLVLPNYLDNGGGGGSQQSFNNYLVTPAAYHQPSSTVPTREKLLTSRKLGPIRATIMPSTELEITQINSQPYAMPQILNRGSLQTIVDQAQIERDMNNDSGYSTKMCGSSHGPSPSLSGQTDLDVNGHSSAIHAKTLVNGNADTSITGLPHQINRVHKNGGDFVFTNVGASSLV